VSSAEVDEKKKASADLRARLDEAASIIVRLLEEMIDKRTRERVRFVNGSVEVDDLSRGTLGYQALRSRLRDAMVDFLRRLYQGTRITPPVNGDATKEVSGE
jgi:hypothetical protein